MADLQARLDARDREGRARAVDPRFNVALEASAGTGKTRVLVDRYVNLLKAGVDPINVLAVTFTRQAAAEMRERVLVTLRAAAERGEIPPSRWRTLRDRTADITISTIDAFCLSLLREFPLEADLDPGFSVADETLVPRLIDESLDRALRICRGVAREDEHVGLVFAQLGDRRARRGLAALLQRRLVAPGVLGRYLARTRHDLTVGQVVREAVRDLLQTFDAMRGGLDGFIATGPMHPAFAILARDLRALRSSLDEPREIEPSLVQAASVRIREHFLTKDGQPRRGQIAYKKALFPNDAIWRVHRAIVLEHGPDILRASQAFTRGLNILLARGTWRMYRIAEAEYRRTLDAHALLDFSDVLERAIGLLRQMEEFAQSRFRLESRYHHVLVDEFQDTSRAQWELMSLLVQAWGAGVGAAYEGPLPPSIFVVGDRKQSIYGFRDADVSLLREAAKYLEGLRPDGDVRRSIARSFRSVPGILAFVNDVCGEMEKVGERYDAFRYDEQDQFPVSAIPQDSDSPLGLIVADTLDASAALVTAEIVRLLGDATIVRDRETGVRRPVTASDVAILFRARESHREFERALEQAGVATYVYKGLGFFDADEIQDVRALLWHLADPASDVRAAAFLRSRFVRLSDEGLRALSPRLSRALSGGPVPHAQMSPDDDVALAWARTATTRWRPLVDVMPPAELLDLVLRESAYAVELRGLRAEQAWENLKKLRSVIRRLQHRGYATLARVAEHLDHLAVGDESNAPVDARDAVSLMTVHASKGLEFPIVFVVDLARGTGGSRDPIRVFVDPADQDDGDVSVSVGDYQSEADEDVAAREREETKRLLYVALTRARDRLYLATTVRDGVIQPARGSLAEVMPLSLLATIAASAASRHDSTVWEGASGAHAFTRQEVVAPVASAPTAAVPDDVRIVDREPVLADEALVKTETGTLGPLPLLPERSDVSSDRILGLAVHRLLQRYGLVSGLAPEALTDAVRGLLRREELAEAGAGGLGAAELAAAAAAAYQVVCRRDDVREAYETGECFHEVPFSLRVDGGVMRGVIDCLVRVPNGRVLVLEFKTGQPRPEHAEQAAWYRRAAEQVFPGSIVDTRMIYAAAG
jgi:ATP-dependent helicase/nuclease subunit A